MMKIIMGILCSLWSVPVIAQQVPDDVNEIVLKSGLDYEEAFEFITSDWLQKGYSLRSADPGTGIVETLPFTVRWGFIDADIMNVSFRCQLNATRGGTLLILNGQVDVDPGGTRFLSMPVSKSGRKKSAVRTSWQLMKDLAERVPSEEVSYRQNPAL